MRQNVKKLKLIMYKYLPLLWMSLGVIALCLTTLLIVSIIPTSGRLETSLHSVNHWVQHYIAIIVAITILLGCLPSTRGTVRNLIADEIKHSLASVWAIFSAALLLVSFKSGEWFIPNRPYVYLYIGVASGVLQVYCLVQASINVATK